MHKCLKLTYIFKPHIYFCIMWLADYLEMLNMSE